MNKKKGNAAEEVQRDQVVDQRHEKLPLNTECKGYKLRGVVSFNWSRKIGYRAYTRTGSKQLYTVVLKLLTSFELCGDLWLTLHLVLAILPLVHQAFPLQATLLQQVVLAILPPVVQATLLLEVQATLRLVGLATLLLLLEATLLLEVIHLLLVVLDTPLLLVALDTLP